jgi:phosphoribosyl-ATP pyrophosphohydrolase
MSDVIKDLYGVILSRREAADENSYTAYLFREGLDKILKKVAEESGETIIAAKSLEAAAAGIGTDAQPSFADGDGKDAQPPLAEDARKDLANEVSDLIYHLLVMLAERGVAWAEVERVLAERAGKAGNLKQQHRTDRNT